MTFDGLGEMFEGDFVDMFAKQIWLMSLGLERLCQAFADTGTKDPIGVSANFIHSFRPLFCGY